MVKSALFKRADEYAVIVKFANGKYFVEYDKRRMFPNDIFTYNMKNFMFLSVPFQDELDPLKSHTRTSWKIEEEDRIKPKYR
jgi:hypothetical protein